MCPDMGWFLSLNSSRFDFSGSLYLRDDISDVQGKCWVLRYPLIACI